MNLALKHFFDDQTKTLSYIVYDEHTLDSVIIDPVLDYDQASSQISKKSVEKIKTFVSEKGLKVHYILETHAHADHLSGAQDLKSTFKGAKIVIGKNITKVQKTFSKIFNLKNLNLSGEQFDILVDESSTLRAGSIDIGIIETPGHTPACVSYLIDKHLFTGDALFMPDYGTGRCDFPAGCAKDLYHSVHDKLYSLPADTIYYTCHDYQPGGRELRYMSTIAESKKSNIQLKDSTSENEFIDFRNKRDETLDAPTLLLPSIQINIDGGRFPKAEDNETSYIKIPLNFKG
jgi:glyoxylase-like metal-dependent hydrolase (beta-lactamase superfamily II)